MNIYLVCNAGMSTSILVKKMQEAAAAKSLSDVHIEAFSVEVLDQRAADADVVLLGPYEGGCRKDCCWPLSG